MSYERSNAQIIRDLLSSTDFSYDSENHCILFDQNYSSKMGIIDVIKNEITFYSGTFNFDYIIELVCKTRNITTMKDLESFLIAKTEKGIVCN